MNRPPRASRTRGAFVLIAAALLLAAPAPGRAQVGNGDTLTKILTDPDKLEELKKERLRPPIEFFRSQVMPNDVLPFIKANHWSMIGLELRANHEDYEGSLQSRPVALAGQPHEMLYRRDARLIKGQRARLTLPVLLPTIPKELGLQLVRPDAIRQDEEWLAPMRVLEPHQQMIVVMSKNPIDAYGRWSTLKAAIPSSVSRDDQPEVDKRRYYRMVLPLDPDKPLLSAHPLTWSPISHVIWDSLPPEQIGVGQQQAMLDWLHFGGQLVVVGGAGPAFAPLRESFLAPYLPAEPTGENAMRTGDELRPLALAYPPPGGSSDPDESHAANTPYAEAWTSMARRYRPPEPIRTGPKKAIFFAGLRPKPGATAIPLGGPDDPPLAVEWRVGRGRVIMTSVGLTEPDLVGWPGFDTLLRRVILRRPEERISEPFRYNANGIGFLPPRYESLVGPDLTGVRYLSRDLGAPTRQEVDEDGQLALQGYTVNGRVPGSNVEVPVGEWLDTAELPSLARERLEQASGIEIPSSRFVLKVILAYIFVLVPVNYLICRYVLRRQELAWIVVPTLSLAFAVGVERAAAYDVGFDSSCDEVDLLETHGDYPRGHVSRFGSIYSTGRVRYSISYPKDPTALALPLATGRSLRGEDASQSSFQTLPIPALTGFQVQPRSLALFRAEQLASVPGTPRLSGPAEGPPMVINEGGLDLNDAWVVQVRPEGSKTRAAYLGDIAAGEKVPLGELAEAEPRAKAGAGQLDPGVFVDLLLKRAVAARPEEVDELRLIGWSPKPLPGEEIDPPVDRRRGFTLVVAHLRPASLLGPGHPRYNALATGPERLPPEPAPPTPDPNVIFRNGRNRGRPMPIPVPPPTPAPVPEAPAPAEAPPTSPPTSAPENPRP